MSTVHYRKYSWYNMGYYFLVGGGCSDRYPAICHHVWLEISETRIASLRLRLRLRNHRSWVREWNWDFQVFRGPLFALVLWSRLKQRLLYLSSWSRLKLSLFYFGLVDITADETFKPRLVKTKYFGVVETKASWDWALVVETETFYRLIKGIPQVY